MGEKDEEDESIEKPGEDATAAEIMRWMESDFWGSFAEGIDLDEEEENEDS